MIKIVELKDVEVRDENDDAHVVVPVHRSWYIRLMGRTGELHSWALRAGAVAVRVEVHPDLDLLVEKAMKEVGPSYDGVVLLLPDRRSGFFVVERGRDGTARVPLTGEYAKLEPSYPKELLDLCELLRHDLA